MKHSHGNLISTAIPIIILASVAVAGWYYYYSEVDKNQSLTIDSRSEQGELRNKLENLQTTVNKLLEDESALQTRLESEKKSQQGLATLLEQTVAEKMAMEASLQQEVDRITSTTAELGVELKKRQALQKSLHDEISSVSDEKSQLLIQLELEKKSQQELAALLEQNMAEKMAMESSLRQEVNKITLTTAELEAELIKRQAAQKSLHDEINTVSGEKSQLLIQLEQEQNSKKNIENLKNRLEQELSESRVEISQLKNQMTVIKLTSEVLFSSGSAEIKPAGQKVLSIIAESLNAYPHRAISIEGHTDNVPMIQNRRYASNWELSIARGLAALNYFQKNKSVDPGRLKVVGYGQYRPVSSNETAEGRKRNRRIEIRMHPPETTETTQGLAG